MPTIDIIIRNKTASAVNPPCIVCGNSDYNVKFDFDDEWQAHNNKIGVFAYNRCGKWQSEKVLFEGDTCPVPVLHGVRSVWIGVTAGDVRTSTPAGVPCRMGATDFSDTTEKPSADIWGQILDKLDSIGTGGATPDWAQNDPDGEGYIKNRCGGYDIIEQRESEIQYLTCPADENSTEAPAGSSFFPPSAGDVISVTIDGRTKEYTVAETTVNGESVLWFGTQDPSSITDIDAFIASDKWVGTFLTNPSGYNSLVIDVSYGALSEVVGKTIGVKQRGLRVAPVKINRRYLDVPDWAKADSKPTYTANDVGAVPTDSVTTAVNAESTNENVPTAKAVYDALQDIDIPSGTDISLGVTATVGQTIKVKAVDADGKPTAWEAVDMTTSDTEVWEELTHFVYTVNNSVNSVKQTFSPGAYKKIYITGHIVLSGTNNPVIIIDSDSLGAPKVFDKQATSGTFRVLIEAFGTGVAVHRTGRTPDNEYAWNGGWDTTTKNNVQMIDIAFVELFSGHKNTNFVEGTDFTIYGVKA